MLVYKAKANVARVLHNNRAKFLKDFFVIVQYTDMADMMSGAEDLRQQWPEPGCWPVVFVKTMVFWGCSVSRAQKAWLWSLLFKIFRQVQAKD